MGIGASDPPKSVDENLESLSLLRVGFLTIVYIKIKL